MKVLLWLLNRPVYCADWKWKVTLLPLTVGSDAHTRTLLRALHEVVDELELRREVRV